MQVENMYWQRYACVEG
uniref:Uncharacterized protein n=1 Tax=Vitis vinifera TaxID=29760 RepID=F6HGF3_VITVI